MVLTLFVTYVTIKRMIEKGKKLLYQDFVNEFLLLMLTFIPLSIHTSLCSALIFNFEIWLYCQYAGDGSSSFIDRE